MTKWKTVRGSMTEEPKAIDMTTSPTTVYERRNISKVTVENESGSVDMWEYEERQMTIEEYESMQNALETPAMQTIMQAISSIELAVEMQGVNLDV